MSDVWVRKFSDAIKAELGWSLDDVDALIAQAERQNIGPLDAIKNERRFALMHFMRDFHDDAMLAARSLFHAAQALKTALELLPLQKPAKSGQKSIDGAREENARRTKEANAKRAKWQKLADAKWADPQHASKSALAIAGLIAKPGENADTIRRAIKKKLA